MDDYEKIDWSWQGWKNELLGNKEQSEPAENTCIKATFELFAVALRK